MPIKPIINILAGTCAVATLLAAGPLQAATKLSVVTFGGAYEAAVKSAYF
ncbi:hypothetical protein [Metapseudomonas sp. CR1201]